jgi:hypothetical protein
MADSEAPVVSAAVRSLIHPNGKCTVLTDVSSYSAIENALEDVTGVEVIAVPMTKGALCTALLASDSLDPGAPVVIAPGDSYFTQNVSNSISNLLELGIFAGTITLSSDSPDLSYLRVSRDGSIHEVLEKRTISNIATTGVFIFGSANDFLEAASWVIVNNMSIGGNFFTSAAMNHAILAGGKVASLSVESTGSEFIKPRYGIRAN